MFFYSYCDLTGNLTDLFVLPLLSKYAKVTLNFVLLHQQRLNNKKKLLLILKLTCLLIVIPT